MLRTDFSIEVCSKLIFPRNSQYSPPSIREIALVFRIFIDVSKRMKMLHVHEILVLSTAQTCTFHLSFIFNFWNGIQLFVTILENALHLHFDRRILPRDFALNLSMYTIHRLLSICLYYSSTQNQSKCIFVTSYALLPSPSSPFCTFPQFSSTPTLLLELISFVLTTKLPQSIMQMPTLLCHELLLLLLCIVFASVALNSTFHFECNALRYPIVSRMQRVNSKQTNESKLWTNMWNGW